MKFEKKNLPKSEVEIKITLDVAEFESYHAKAFQAIQKDVEIDGFRKGNAPEDMVVKKYGEMIVLEEMANIALRDAYIKAVDEHKINPVAQPNVTITKIAKGNPFEATIVVPIMPEVTLPDYKKIAKVALDDKETTDVKEEDVQNVLEELRKGRTKYNDETHHHEHGENCNHDEEVPADAEVKEPEEKSINLPALDDEFAQSFGESFKTLDDLKKKVGENLKLEKEQKLREKRRTAIIDKLIEESKADIPDAMVEGELANMMQQFKGDITRFGGTWEEYLTQSKKTEDEIKNDWKKDAEKRAMSQLVLHKIGEAEKLQATEAEVEVELIRLLAQVQDADEDRARSYLYQTLTNDKVFRFLEQSS
jgi:trigger factor